MSNVIDNLYIDMEKSGEINNPDETIKDLENANTFTQDDVNGMIESAKHQITQSFAEKIAELEKKIADLENSNIVNDNGGDIDDVESE